MILNPRLRAYLASLLQETDLISEDRKTRLGELAAYVRHKQASGEPVALTFICTHNSRRCNQIIQQADEQDAGDEDTQCLRHAAQGRVNSNESLTTVQYFLQPGHSRYCT